MHHKYLKTRFYSFSAINLIIAASIENTIFWIQLHLLHSTLWTSGHCSLNTMSQSVNNSITACLWNIRHYFYFVTESKCIFLRQGGEGRWVQFYFVIYWTHLYRFRFIIQNVINMKITCKLSWFAIAAVLSQKWFLAELWGSGVGIMQIFLFLCLFYAAIDLMFSSHLFQIILILDDDMEKLHFAVNDSN